MEKLLIDFRKVDLSTQSISSKESNITKRGELIACFNDVFALSKSALDIMSDLNNSGKEHFSINTYQTNSESKTAPYTSTIKFTDIATFTFSAATEIEARDEVIRQAFTYLKNISMLMTFFKSIYCVTHCPLTIIRELIPKNGDIIKAHTAPHEDGFQTTVQLISFGLFYDYATTELESQKAAFEGAVNYLKKLSNVVFGTPKEFNPLHNDTSSALVAAEAMAKDSTSQKESYEHFVYDPKTWRRNTVGSSTTKVTSQETTPVNTATKSSFSKRVELMKNFNKVYAASKKPVVVFNELLHLYPADQVPPLYITTTYDSLHQTYRSLVCIDGLASLSAIDLTESESKRKAQLKAFNFLIDFSTLVRKFSNNYSDEKASFDLLEELTRHHSYMVKVNSIRERASRYRATVQIVNLHSFTGIGSTELESKEAAARSAIEYFKDFSDRIQ